MALPEKNNAEMIAKFTNYVMLDGKKALAKRIMQDTFAQIQAK